MRVLGWILLNIALRLAVFLFVFFAVTCLIIELAPGISGLLAQVLQSIR